MNILNRVGIAWSSLMNTDITNVCFWWIIQNKEAIIFLNIFFIKIGMGEKQKSLQCTAPESPLKLNMSQNSIWQLFCAVLILHTTSLFIADFSDPFEPPGAKKAKGAFVPNDMALQMVMGMGFNKEQATKALFKTVSWQYRSCVGRGF